MEDFLGDSSSSRISNDMVGVITGGREADSSNELKLARRVLRRSGVFSLNGMGSLLFSAAAEEEGRDSNESEKSKV